MISKRKQLVHGKCDASYRMFLRVRKLKLRSANDVLKLASSSICGPRAETVL